MLNFSTYFLASREGLVVQGATLNGRSNAHALSKKQSRLKFRSRKKYGFLYQKSNTYDSYLLAQKTKSNEYFL